MKALAQLAVAAGLLYLPVSAVATKSAAHVAPVPVQVGNDDDLDACPSWGEPKGLNPGGDNFLAVRSAPGIKGQIIYRLQPGEGFWICDESGDGQWTGIVVNPDFAPDKRPDSEPDCLVGTPISPRQDYPGPCPSGWVSSRYVLLVAG